MKTLLPRITLKFEPRDIWVGVYWEYNKEAIMTRWLKVYLCILPMLPICFKWIWYSRRYYEARGQFAKGYWVRKTDEDN